MLNLSEKNFDRRNYPRTLINSQVSYKLANDTSYSEAIMIDVSQTGVLLDLKHELAEEALLTLIMKSDKEDEPPIEITAEVARAANANNDDTYSYGCLILDVKNL